jgi:hypothetical protein
MGEYLPSDADDSLDQAPESDYGYPADFSPDEIEFAAVLRDLFSAEREELPPLYVQTLAGDGRCPPVESSFEQKVTYQVFRRLGLQRRPLVDPHQVRPLAQYAPVVPPMRRLGRMGGAVATCAVALMLLSVVVASPSFAVGIRMLLSHTGVQPVSSYPPGVHSSASVSPRKPNSAVTSVPLTQVDWFGRAVEKYVYQYTQVNSPQEWSDGPVVELVYTRQDNSPGSGWLDVREFRLSPAYAGVLQVVADGSADSVMVGDLPGVYVDGRWVRSTPRPGWETGIKSELIFERDGLIFWIVADQRDGTGQDQLVAAAQQLQSVSLHSLTSSRPSLRAVTQDLEGALQGPYNDELYYVIPAGRSLDSGAGEFVSFTSPAPPRQ